MPSLNKVMLIGHLGRDPELRYAPSGDPVANFSMATTERWRDPSSDERKERTEWHRIVVWGKQAEVVGEYLKKGGAAYIEGSLRTREWTDHNGNKRSTTEIRAQRVQFLERPKASEPEEAAASDDERTPLQEQDIPF